MKAETIGPLVDTKSAFEALAEYKSQRADRATLRFLRAKLLETSRDLASTAKFLKTEVRGMDAHLKAKRDGT